MNFSFSTIMKISNKAIQDPCGENYKILQKEFNEYLKEWKSS